MKLKFLFIGIIIFFLINEKAFCQLNNDSIPEVIVDSSLVYINIENCNNLFSDYQLLDTTLLFFNRYEPTQKYFSIFSNIGNTGLAHQDGINYFKNHKLFNTSEILFSQYWFDENNFKVYNSVLPYSEVLYVSGGKEENFLDFTLGGKLSQNIYLGIDYRIESSTGSFVNQKSKNSHLRTILFYNSSNYKYSTDFIYCRNKVVVKENGGIVNDAEYEDSVYLDRKLIEVSLLKAQGLVQNNSFDLEQRYFLGKIDSTRYNKLGFIFANIKYSSILREYIDQGQSNLYPYIFLDSSSTYDSLHINSFNSSLGWSNSNNQNEKLMFRVYGDYQKTRYYNYNSLFDYNYFNPYFLVEYKSKFVHFNLDFNQKILLNSNDSLKIGDKNFHFNSEIKLLLDSNISFGFQLLYEEYTPDYTFIRYSGNHFDWCNDFGNTKQLFTKFESSIFGFKLDISNTIVSNYVFISPALRPNQIERSIQVSQFLFSKIFKFKNISIVPFLIFQNSTSTSIISVPKFIGKINASYSFPLFRNAVLLNPGFDLTFLSPYYANTFDPAIGRFVVQNKKEFSSQYALDLFLSFKIKRARILLMYSNFNYLFGNYSYYQIAHYPQKDGVFRFGVSWRFYD